MTPTDDEEQPLRSALGKAMRLRRVELDLSRADLAREAGVSYTYVSEIENGTKQASSKTLWRIARALGLEPHELLAAAAGWETRPLPPGASSGAPAAAPAVPAEGPDPVTDRLRSLGRARLASLESAVGRLAVPEASSAPASRWFHAGRAAATDRARGADPGGDDPSGPEPGPPELVEVLDRLAAALDGVPDERAELALMLALDERRTRRIVREELGRQRHV